MLSDSSFDFRVKYDVQCVKCHFAGFALLDISAMTHNQYGN